MATRTLEAPAPSFSELKAKLEAENAARLQDEIARLAGVHYELAFKRLEKRIRETGDEGLESALDDYLAAKNAKDSGSATTKAQVEKSNKRRTENEKKKLGEAVYKFFKENGESTATAAVEAVEAQGFEFKTNDHIVDLVALVGHKLEHNGQRGLAARYKLKR